jgi:hypothetical protein
VLEKLAIPPFPNNRKTDPQQNPEAEVCYQENVVSPPDRGSTPL